MMLSRWGSRLPISGNIWRRGEARCSVAAHGYHGSLDLEGKETSFESQYWVETRPVVPGLCTEAVEMGRRGLHGGGCVVCGTSVADKDVMLS
jgi:hypothetical protein